MPYGVNISNYTIHPGPSSAANIHPGWAAGNHPDFVPRSIGGLVLWLRADMGVTVNDETITSPNDFTNAAWTKANATATFGFADPFGGNSASKFTEDGTLNQHTVTQTVANRVAGVRETWSVYAKANGRTWLGFNDTTGGVGAWFNLVAGTIGTIQPGVTANMTLIANGWYLCSISATTFNGGLILAMSNADGSFSYTGDGVSGQFFYGITVSQPKVSAWADQSGVGNNATQVTAASQPLLVPNAVNGRPVVRFGATTAVAMGLPNIALGSRATFFVSTSTAGAGRYAWSDGTQNTGFIYGFTANTFEYFNTAADRYVLLVAASGYHVLAASFVNGGALNGYADGAQTFAQNGTVALGTLTTLGNAAGLTSSWADMAEVCFYNRELLPSEIRTVSRYMANRIAVASAT